MSGPGDPRRGLGPKGRPGPPQGGPAHLIVLDVFHELLLRTLDRWEDEGLPLLIAVGSDAQVDLVRIRVLFE